MKKHHLSYIIGGILLLAFAGFSVSSFQDSLTPYVTFEEAKTANRIVQVAGGLLENSTAYDSTSESLTFALEDTQDRKALRYAIIAAVIVHAVLFVIKFPELQAQTGVFRAASVSLSYLEQLGREPPVAEIVLSDDDFVLMK